MVQRLHSFRTQARLFKLGESYCLGAVFEIKDDGDPVVVKV